LYERYFSKIFGFVLRRAENEDLAADLTSQTFLKALSSLNSYRFRNLPFSAWLYKIAANELNKHYRFKKRAMVYRVDEENARKILLGAEEVVSDLYDYSHLLAAMKKLSDKDFHVLELRFFDNKSFAELAYILNITEATAKMRTYRAIEKLKNILKREY
jgi:RNA polymerase sigma-70 factor (ECF subfamily)